jgi:hypothetical protein
MHSSPVRAVAKSEEAKEGVGGGCSIAFADNISVANKFLD